MKHTHALIAASVLVLTMAGCTQLESPLAPGETIASLAPPSANLVTRPWEGRCQGTGAFRADFITLDVTGTCHLSHLGLTTIVGVETITPVAGGFQSSAVNVYTAANGDILNTTGTGVATFLPDFSGISFSFNETVVGGTGRFANASGNVTRIGSSRFSDGSGSWEIGGTLIYAASDR